MSVVTIQGAEFYIDDELARKLERIATSVDQEDKDYFCAIDGGEGSGKSVLAMQLAKFVDPTFCLDRIVFSAEQFRDAILNGKKGQAIVFDEAFRGLSSRGALTEINKLLVSLMMECRQRNLIIFIVMPSFFMLDRYAALHRAKMLLHTYERQGKRGYWVCFSKKKAKLLYLKGKSTYSYNFPRSDFRGRFIRRYVVDEALYRAKKAASFQTFGNVTRAEVYLSQRNLLLYYLNKEFGMTTVKLSEELEKYAWKIAQNTISEAIINKKQELTINGII